MPTNRESAPGKLIKCRLMLLLVLVNPIPEEFSAIGPTGMKSYCIVFVIPHYGIPVSIFDDCSRYLNHFGVCRPSINEVTHKHDLPFIVTKSITASPVAKLTKKFFQFCGMAMNVTDDVIMSHKSPSCWSVEEERGLHNPVIGNQVENYTPQ